LPYQPVDRRQNMSDETSSLSGEERVSGEADKSVVFFACIA